MNNFVNSNNFNNYGGSNNQMYPNYIPQQPSIYEQFNPNNYFESDNYEKTQAYSFEHTYTHPHPHPHIYTHINMLNQEIGRLTSINQMLHSSIAINSQLSLTNLANYNNMIGQMELLKRENFELKQCLVEYKKNINEMSINSNTGITIAPTLPNPPETAILNNTTNDKTTNINKYQIRKYYPNSKSWSNEKINECIKNLSGLKDIVKLKKEWYGIRHNEKLQKLCNIAHPVEKLDKMIGLKDVKKEIFKIIIYYIQNPHTDEYLHTVIMGPPGVGKTQIAKIYSEIFVRLGILKSDKFIEIKRDDLVAKYLGHTSPKTKELLESAMGGVVFLDEGYSLGNEEKRDSFAKEAIDMINQYLSERKKDFMFVVAGYKEDLDKCFFSFNRGLKRRFGHWIEITKYSKDELVQIFESKIKDLGYQLDISVDSTQLNNFFDKNYLKFENYAGDIEKFVNFIKYEQSFRTFRSNIQDKTICYSDMTLSIEKFLLNDRYELPFGLYV